MKEEKWIETKREYEVNDGEQKLKKVTSELQRGKMDRKEKLDLLFRSISVVAIGIPIFLFYMQQRTALKSQKNIQQLQVYSNYSTEFKSLLNRPVLSTEYEKSKNKLLYELTPPVAYYFPDTIYNDLENLNEHLGLYAIIAKNCDIQQSLFKNENFLGSFLTSYKNNTFKAPVIEQEHVDQLKLIDSLKCMLVEDYAVLDRLLTSQDNEHCELHKLGAQLNSFTNQQLPFHTTYVAQCSAVYKLVKAGQSTIDPESQAQFNSLDKNKIALIKSAVKYQQQLESIRAGLREKLEERFINLQSKMKKENKLLQST